MSSPGQAQLTVGVRNFSARPQADWRHVLDQARAAEDAGIDRICVSDHLVFGADLSAYADPASGGVSGGVQPTGPDGEWLEALTALAAMSAVTERVRLSTNILVAPLRRAVVLAKVASTLDVLSHGRFELGVGIGWQEDEYRAAGVEFARRGRVLDEMLEACRQLWTAEVATLETEDFSLAGVHMMPKPTDASGVPVWIGGRPIPATARRIGRYGAGWIPWGATTPDTVVDAMDEMSLLLAAEGRDLSTVQVAYALPTVLTDAGTVNLAAVFADVPRLVDRGITDFRSMLRLPKQYEQARDFLGELRQHFDRVIGGGAG